MTLEETERILQVLRINYPMSYKNMTQEDTQAYLKLWQVSFKDYEYLVVAKAVNQIIQSDTREFAPNVAQVKTRISKTAIGKTKEAGEAWEIVLGTLSVTLILVRSTTINCLETFRKHSEGAIC